MAGRLIAFVGPSGVGKDSVMRAVAAARPGTHLVRRVITRGPDAGSEDHEPCSVVDFLRREAAGEFLLSWQAHGLHYGIPGDVGQVLAGGQDALVNLSRSVLGEARARFPGFMVVHLTAPVPVLAARLAARGRENATGVERRLTRAGFALPPGIGAVTIDNSGPLDQTVASVLALLEEVSVR